MKSTRKSWIGWLALVLLLPAAARAQSPEYDAQSGSVRINGGNPYADYRSDAGLEPIPDGAYQGHAIYQNYSPYQLFGGGSLPPDGVKIDPAFRAAAGLGGPSLSELDRIRFDLYKVSGEVAGQGTGFTNLGAFVPFRVFSDYNLFAVNPRVLIDDTGNAGFNFGAIHRFYVPALDRMFGHSYWWDFSRSYHDDMHQFGLSLETVGRYLSYRFNANWVAGNRQRVFHQQIFDPVLGGNNILVPVLQYFETGVSNYTFEVAMPAPFLGKYGLELGVGPYVLTASGVQDAIGVAGRAQWQITEDFWVNTVVTNDDLFDTNVSVNFELRLPNGMPSRILRPNPVVMSLTQSVQRNYQIKVARAQRMKFSPEINPRDSQPFQIAIIDPNRTTPGNGTAENPYMSTADYMAAPLAVRQGYDIIFVRRRGDNTDFNLDTTLTLEFCQRLLGDGTLPDRIPHLYTSTRGTFVLPGQTPGPLPLLTNNGVGVAPGTPIVRLNNENEVSGFRIQGPGTGGAGQTSVGILGVGTRHFNINRNFFHNVTDAVRITADTAALGTANIGRLDLNTVTGASDDGFEIRAVGALDPLRLDVTRNYVRNAQDNGMHLVVVGSTLNGRIADNRFEANGNNGVQIDVGAAGRVQMANPDGGRNIANNSFSGNGANGLQVNSRDGTDTRINLWLTGNVFGDPSAVASDNQEDGFQFNANSGQHVVRIGDVGGVDPTRGNRFLSNLDDAVSFNLSGSAVATADIEGNILSSGGGGASSIGTNFTGSTINESGFIPPDTMGAVGVNHIVEMLNGVFAIYDKGTGNLVSRVTLDNFFDSVIGITRLGGTFDPRIIYDPTTNRWIAAAIDGGAGNRIYIAVSDTGDPTGTWRGVQFVGDVAGGGTRFNDFDTLGVTADAVVIGTNNFGAGFDISIYSIPKADLLSGAPSIANMTRFENLAGSGETPQAVVDLLGPSDGVVEVLNNLFPGGTNLLLRNVSGAGAAGATLSGTSNVAVPNYTVAPNARQPGGTPPLENVSPRFNGNVVKVGNSIWAVHAVAGTSGNSAIRWYEIDAATATVRQTGLIEDPQVDYLDASIAVNQQGKVVIGFTGSGPNQNPSAMVVTGTTSGGVTNFGTPFITQAGVSPYFLDFGSGRNRWGDYSATVNDPVAPNTFWTFQEYAAGSATWAVQITQILLGTAGRNGIHINTADTSRLVNSRIVNNQITGYTENGILVDARDASIVRNLLLSDNTFDGNGNSIHLIRRDSADFRLTSLLRNTSNSATNNGLFIQAFGTATPSMDVRLFDNLFQRSGDSNLRVETFDDAVVNFFGPRDRFDLGGAGLTAVLNNNSVQNLTFENTTFDNNTGHGQLLTVNHNATLNYVYTSPRDDAATFHSSTSGNGSFGLLVRAFNNGLYNLTIGSPGVPAAVVFNGNTDVGIGIDATDNSVGFVDIVNTSVSGTRDGPDAVFNGEGLGIRLRNNARLNRLRVGQTTATDTSFSGNAGDGVRLNLNQTARIVDPLFDRVLVNGNAGHGFAAFLSGNASLPNARLWRSSFSGNGVDGIHVERSGAGVIDNFRIGGRDGAGNDVGNLINGNGDDGIELIARNNNIIDDYTIAENSIQSNGTNATATGRRGIHLRAEGDAQISADILFNVINSNASHGIQLTTEQNAIIGDSRSVTGRWLGNQINSNGADGINLGGVHGFLGNLPSPLQIGDLGTDALGRSFGNEIRFNAESGINITPFSDFFHGPFGNSTANIVNNLINGNTLSGIDIEPSASATFAIAPALLVTNIFDNEISDNLLHGVNTENRTTGLVTTNLQRNLITRNARDGVQILGHFGNGSINTVDGSIFVTITDNNIITNNGGRGIDMLVRGTANAQVVIDQALVAENTEEGVYAVVTASLEQDNEVRSSVPLSQTGSIFNDAFLDLTVTNSAILSNNTAGGSAGGGLVLRVGTTGAFPGLAQPWADPNTTDPTLGGGLLARIDNNVMDNNFGVDFFIHTFTSTVDPATTGGTWSDNNSIPRTDVPNPPGDNTFDPQGYQQDPLARITLTSVVGNSGTSADVFGLSLLGGFNNQNFAFYNNTEAVFKSRTQNQDGTDPPAGFVPGIGIIDDNGPFSNASAGNRIRNATRLPYRDFDGDSVPDVPPLLQILHGPRDSNEFLFPGLGDSTLRIDAFSDLLLSGFTTVISDFTDVITFANSGVPAGILPPNSPFYAFDTF